MAQQLVKARTVLITGANRGLGLKFAEKLLSQPRPPTHVVCCCRIPDRADELAKLRSKHTSVHILTLDVTKSESFPQLRNHLNVLIGDYGLNLLINNAGVFPGKPQPLEWISQSALEESFKSNVFGPLLLTKELLPLLRTAAKQQAEEYGGASVVNLTSGYASAALSKTGSLYAYAPSKAALNRVTKLLANDLQKDGIVTVALNPGWVKTDMGGPQAPLTADHSVTKMLELIGRITIEQSGSFVDHSGRILPF